MNEALCVIDLSKSFEGFRLQNINFAIEKGSIMGLIGSNGSGKTTTIKLILNLLERQSGVVSVLGFDNKKEEQLFKEKISVVFDSHFFVDEWKASDVEKAMRMFYKNWDTGMFYAYLDTFHIGRNKRVSELSKGMQMKLMLAGSFSHGAQLLILDEPTSGLDPVSRDELLDILHDYTKDKNHSVLFSTHITEDLNKIADSITFIHQGKQLYTGAKERFTSQYRIISGDQTRFSEEIKSVLIGSKMMDDRFEGLIRIENLAKITDLHVKNRPAEIDDVIVYADRCE